MQRQKEQMEQLIVLAVLNLVDVFAHLIQIDVLNVD